MKTSVKIFGLFAIIGISFMFVSCPQANAEKPTSETPSVPTIDEVAKMAVKDSLTDLAIDVSGFENSYESINGKGALFAYEKIYVGENKTQFVHAFSALWEANTGVEYALIKDNTIVEANYEDALYYQYVWESTNRLLSMDGITVEYQNENFTTNDFQRYEQTFNKHSKERTSDDYSLPLPEWTFEENQSREILLKETDDGLIVINLTNENENKRSFDDSDVTFFKTKLKATHSYVPPSNLIDSAVSEGLSAKEITIPESAEEYRFTKNIGGDNYASTAFAFSAFVYNETITALTVPFFNGVLEDLETDGTVTKKEYTHEVFEAEITTYTKLGGTLLYELQELNLNGYVLYSYPSDSSTKYALIKEQGNSLYICFIDVKNSNTLISIEVLYVYNKQ